MSSSSLKYEQFQSFITNIWAKNTKMLSATYVTSGTNGSDSATFTISDRISKSKCSDPIFHFPVSQKWQTRQEQLEKWKEFKEPAQVAWIGSLNACWDKIDFLALEQIASDARGGIRCACSDRCAIGGQSLVYELAFEDEVSWIARIRRDPPPPFTPGNPMSSLPKHAAIMTSEIATMQYIKSHTTVPVPSIYAYSYTSHNPVNAPYILMEGFIGRNPIGESNHVAIQQPVPEEFRRQYYTQLADIMMQLSVVRFDKIGSLCCDRAGEVYVGPLATGGGGPYSSAEEYYEGFANTHLKEKFPESTLMSELYKMMTRFSSEESAPRGPPFPLGHGDFGIHNLIINDEWNIIALVDWEFAATTPWESFCNFPGGLILPACPEEPPHVRVERECFAVIFEERQEQLAQLGRNQMLESPFLSNTRASRAFKCIERAILDGTNRCHYIVAYLGLVFGEHIVPDLELALKSWRTAMKEFDTCGVDTCYPVWSCEIAEFFRRYIKEHLA